MRTDWNSTSVQLKTSLFYTLEANTNNAFLASKEAMNLRDIVLRPYWGILTFYTGVILP